ncbi:MAG: hypothetical protein ACLQVL_06960 [Terriglobia bacterium]
MEIPLKNWLLLVLCALLTSIATAQTQPAAQEGKRLGGVAREQDATEHLKSPCPPNMPCNEVSSRSQLSPGVQDDRERVYRAQIHALLGRRALAELDEAADSARASKERLGGGVWKLYVFYEVVAMADASQRVSEQLWLQRVALLRDWVAANPSSVTARVALAYAYHAYAWAARGGGYADTVPDAGWKRFETRIAQAYSTLLEADTLPAKCPHWYLVMLLVARDMNWDKDQMRALFERAVAFEPSYYLYYREYASDLLPKWGGEPGEAEAFAEESYRRIGGRQGAFVYFEIATVLYCLCNDSPQPTLSWPVLQEGFAETEEQYGATLLKLNRFAMLAYLYHDREVAKRILARVGDNWEPKVWVYRATFNLARSWAAGLVNPSEVPGVAIAAPAKPRPPSVFLLKNGEKLEARRYTITGGSLHVTADGKPRVIPLTELDLNATLAANSERGVNLRIPTNPNDVVLGF